MTSNFLLTIDVEDWFQVENFKPWIPFSKWDLQKSRVEQNVNILLDLLDDLTENYPYQLSSSNPPSRIKATFFVLGWIAERFPHLIRKIGDRGHEVASHGFNHTLNSDLSSKKIETDITDSKKCLEDIIGDKIYGYRSPSFSISNEVLKIIEQCGFLYDSSYNSFSLHDRYGRIKLENKPTYGIAHEIKTSFFEIPVSNLNIGIRNFDLPWGGGGFFRLFPIFVFELGVKYITKKQNDYLFFLHPWEIDPGQPQMEGVGRINRFRHYYNLDINITRIRKLILAFKKKCNFSTCKDYLDQQIEARKRQNTYK